MTNYALQDLYIAASSAHGGNSLDEVSFNEKASLVLNELLSRAWEEGFRSGHSLAMRRMSDEPGATGNPNPYKEEA